MGGFDLNIALDHLRTQFRKGLPVLFTGAGFSAGATDADKHSLPLASGLARELWPIAFPGEPFDDRSALQDIYQQAARAKPERLKQYLTRRLTATAFPTYYEIYFAAAWHRIYTVNVDDLASAVARAHALPRQIRIISALRWSETSNTRPNHDFLEIIALHGTLEDLPDGVTFSRSQYAGRASAQDPWYAHIAADLLSHPTVFVGASLEEPLLWEHIEIRRLRGDRRSTRELRPRSYLVTPTLDRARQALLTEFNVVWLPLTSEEFATKVLAQLGNEMAQGIKSLASTRREARRAPKLSTVSELQPLKDTKNAAYLLGQEPSWGDIQAGVAIKRSVDEELWQYASTELAQDEEQTPLLISGTAGSGKSTALMRLALRLTAQGVEVGWIDRETDLTTNEIVGLMRRDGAPRALAIDDAGTFGSALSGIIRDITSLDSHPLILLAVRSGKVERVLNPDRLGTISPKEITMPHLTDDDIDGLIDVLDREGLLGVLRNKPRTEQRLAFREKAGRQLLVAMYEATSGRRFEEKVTDEYDELTNVARDFYALISIASHFQHALPQDELLLALGSVDNTALNQLNLLESRRLVVKSNGSSKLKARHRVIATVVVEHLQRGSGLAQYLQGLTWAAATRVSPELNRQDPQWRFLKRLLSHETLFRLTSVEEARALYEYCEQLLRWDFHFWLQRGSLEVEEGRLELAENFLAQALALQPNDPFVLTEWAYFLLRRAIARPEVDDAAEAADKAIRILQARIISSGGNDEYPFHVLGAQGLSWARHGRHTKEERRKLLTMLRSEVKRGVEKHPGSRDLQQLLEDLRREELGTVVRKSSSSGQAKPRSKKTSRT
jgi:tetratricopeptide (TPR) repeat protein